MKILVILRDRERSEPKWVSDRLYQLWFLVVLLCEYKSLCWSVSQSFYSVLLQVRHEVMGEKGKKGNVHFRNRGCKEVFDCFQSSIVLGVFYCFYHLRSSPPLSSDTTTTTTTIARPLCLSLYLFWTHFVVSRVGGCEQRISSLPLLGVDQF